jgi:hypothetical protein
MMPGKDPLWMLYDTTALTSMLDFKASAEFTRALDTEHRAEQLVHFFAAASQAVAKELRGIGVGRSQRLYGYAKQL